MTKEGLIAESLTNYPRSWALNILFFMNELKPIKEF